MLLLLIILSLALNILQMCVMHTQAMSIFTFYYKSKFLIYGYSFTVERWNSSKNVFLNAESEKHSITKCFSFQQTFYIYIKHFYLFQYEGHESFFYYIY